MKSKYINEDVMPYCKKSRIANESAIANVLNAAYVECKDKLSYRKSHGSS